MISIVIPLYNQADKLSKCLESIKNQTYGNFEVIIVNDGSTDNYLPVIEKYQSEMGYKIDVVEQENQGSNPARNNGAKLAKGEYIIFCDADVIMQPDMLEKMYQELQSNPQKSYVYSSFKYGWKTFRLWPFDAAKLQAMPYIHTTSLIRKENFPGFDEKIKRLQDWDLWLTMLEKNQTGLWIDKVLFTVQADGHISFWLPSFTYRVMPFLGKVKNYKQAEKIIKDKHNL